MRQISEVYRPRLRPNLRIARQVTDNGVRSSIVVKDPILRGLTHPGYRLSPQAETLLDLLDGSRSVATLAEALQGTGQRVTGELVAAFVDKLTDLNLLETPAADRTVKSLEQQFASLPVRPMTTNTLGPSTPGQMKAAIDACFEEVSLEEDTNGLACRGRPHALVVPHAGVEVSGTCAARTLKLLANGPLPSLYVIVGPNHVAPGVAKAEIIPQPFETPLGRVEVDADTSTALLDAGIGVVTEHLSHFRDHSIENVLVFLQWLHANHPDPKPFRIVPVLLTGARHRLGMPESEDHVALWHALGALLRDIHDQDRTDRVLIASADFSHVGAYFDFTPPGLSSADDIRRWEEPVRAAILSGDADSFRDLWAASNACAGRPLITLLEATSGWSWELSDQAVKPYDDNFLSVASYAAWPVNAQPVHAR